MLLIVQQRPHWTLYIYIFEVYTWLCYGAQFAFSKEIHLDSDGNRNAREWATLYNVSARHLLVYIENSTFRNNKLFGRGVGFYLRDMCTRGWQSRCVWAVSCVSLKWNETTHQKEAMGVQNTWYTQPIVLYAKDFYRLAISKSVSSS